MSTNLTIDQLIDELQQSGNVEIWSTMALEWQPVSDSQYWVRRWWVYVVPTAVDWQPWSEPGEWDYGTWRFVRHRMPLATVMETLSGWREKRGIGFQNLTLQFGDSQRVSWQESFQWAYSSPQMRHRLIPFAAKLCQSNDLLWSQESVESGPLAGDDLPYFPSVREALRWWIDGVNPFSLWPDMLSNQTFGFWIIDGSPRIRRVRLKAHTVEVDVEGIGDKEVSVAMYSQNTVGIVPQRVSQDGTVTFPSPTVLQKAEWVVSADHKILDRKFFSDPPQYGTGFAVDVEPADADRLKEWILQGENATTEFKRQIPIGQSNNINKEWDEFLESAVAFANTSGGRILVGVDDHGHILGVSHPDDIIKKIQTRFHANITPSLEFDFSTVETQGFEGGPRVVVVVTVSPGNLPAYAIERGTDPPKFFIRRGSTDLPATREELERLFVSRPTRGSTI